MTQYSNLTIAEIRKIQIYTIDCEYDLRKQELPIILSITLIANIVSVLGLFKMPSKENTINHMMVKILAVNDLVTTVSILGQWIAHFSNCRVLGGELGCTITGWMTTTLVIWSPAVVTTMNVCRYMSVSKPILYRQYITKKKILISLCGSFIWILFEMSLPLYGIVGPYMFYTNNKICSYDFAPGNYGMFHKAAVAFLGVFGIASIIIVIYCNISIAYQVRLRERNKKATTATTETETGAQSIPGETGGNQRIASVSKTTVAVAGAYTICYGPFVIRLVVDSITNAKNVTEIEDTITTALVFINPLVNPVVYILFNKQYRQYLASKLCGCCMKRNDVAPLQKSTKSDSV